LIIAALFKKWKYFDKISFVSMKKDGYRLQHLPFSNASMNQFIWHTTPFTAKETVSGNESSALP